MITEYEQYCSICGSPAVNIHHLCFGNALRRLCDEDELLMPLCNSCHDAIHHGKETKVTQMMSRIIGQLEYEKNKCAAGMSKSEARESFRKRYNVSYL